MPRRNIRLLLLFCGCCILSLGLILFQSYIRAHESDDEAIHALVFNKPTSLLEFELIGNYPHKNENISVYAILEDIETIDSKTSAYHLREFENQLIAYSYTPFSKLEIGHSYLFEGYIEVVNGQNRFVIETIEIP